LARIVCTKESINPDRDIYDLLLETDKTMFTAYQLELNKVSGTTLIVHAKELQKVFTHQTNAVILATGYRQVMPDCIKPLRPFIHLDNSGKYKANLNYDR
jgi:lysine N6-hydroxylase